MNREPPPLLLSLLAVHVQAIAQVEVRARLRDSFRAVAAALLRFFRRRAPAFPHPSQGPLRRLRFPLSAPALALPAPLPAACRPGSASPRRLARSGRGRSRPPRRRSRLDLRRSAAGAPSAPPRRRRRESRRRSDRGRAPRLCSTRPAPVPRPSRRLKPPGRLRRSRRPARPPVHVRQGEPPRGMRSSTPGDVHARTAARYYRRPRRNSSPSPTRATIPLPAVFFRRSAGSRPRTRSASRRARRRSAAFSSRRGDEGAERRHMPRNASAPATTGTWPRA